MAQADAVIARTEVNRPSTDFCFVTECGRVWNPSPQKGVGRYRREATDRWTRVLPAYLFDPMASVREVLVVNN